MNIRILKNEELSHAAGLSRYVFDACLRGRMEFTQSIPFIEDYISEINIRTMCSENRLIVWGAFEGEQLVAVGGMQPNEFAAGNAWLCERYVASYKGSCKCYSVLDKCIF